MPLSQENGAAARRPDVQNMVERKLPYLAHCRYGLSTAGILYSAGSCYESACTWSEPASTCCKVNASLAAVVHYHCSCLEQPVTFHSKHDICYIADITLPFSYIPGCGSHTQATVLAESAYAAGSLSLVIIAKTAVTL